MRSCRCGRQQGGTGGSSRIVGVSFFLWTDGLLCPRVILWIVAPRCMDHCLRNVPWIGMGFAELWATTRQIQSIGWCKWDAGLPGDTLDLST